MDHSDLTTRRTRKRWPALPAEPGPPRPLHEPARPAWRCPTCDEEWPCGRRRAMLRADCGGSRVHLALLLASYFADAVTERPDITPAAFHARFLGWLQDR